MKAPGALLEPAFPDSLLDLRGCRNRVVKVAGQCLPGSRITIVRSVSS